MRYVPDNCVTVRVCGAHVCILYILCICFILVLSLTEACRVFPDHLITLYVCYIYPPRARPEAMPGGVTPVTPAPSLGNTESSVSDQLVFAPKTVDWGASGRPELSEA